MVNAGRPGRVYTCVMDARPPKPLSPAGEVVRSLRTWPDEELWDLAQAVGCELDRRLLAQPVALPIAAALANLSTGYSVLSTQD